jgi:hypothetical protein
MENSTFTTQLTQNELFLIFDALVIKQATSEITLSKIESGELRKDPEFHLFIKATIEDTQKLTNKVREQLYPNYNPNN